MNLNDDFLQRAAVHAGRLDWVPSPMPGVERKMLDRIGDEVARATSIVCYAPGSAFSRHVHGGGEEFLVLEGVFEDEHGAYPAGTYVRNPPGSAHTPGSIPGCTIFVKLWQFDPADTLQFSLDTLDLEDGESECAPGVRVGTLHADAFETVLFERWAPGARVQRDLPGGAELFVLDGAFNEQGESFARHDWLRLPCGASLDAVAGRTGARVWTKSGHLGAPERLCAPPGGAARA